MPQPQVRIQANFSNIPNFIPMNLGQQPQPQPQAQPQGHNHNHNHNHNHSHNRPQQVINQQRQGDVRRNNITVEPQTSNTSQTHQNNVNRVVKIINLILT